MIFSKRIIRTTSIPKNRKIHSGVWKRPKTLKNGYFGQILTIFGHFGGQKLFRPKNFWWSSKSYRDTTSCKKSKKKIKTVKAVGPERLHGHTHGRERVYRFPPESKDIRGTNKNFLSIIELQLRAKNQKKYEVDRLSQKPR